MRLATMLRTFLTAWTLLYAVVAEEDTSMMEPQLVASTTTKSSPSSSQRQGRVLSRPAESTRVLEYYSSNFLLLEYSLLFISDCKFPYRVADFFCSKLMKLLEFVETWGFAISFATFQPGNRSEYVGLHVCSMPCNFGPPGTLTHVIGSLRVRGKYSSSKLLVSGSAKVLSLPRISIFGEHSLQLFMVM